jgi:hypothetical protein
MRRNTGLILGGIFALLLIIIILLIALEIQSINCGGGYVFN